MKKIKTKLKGLFIFESKIYHDQRGNVREAFKKELTNKSLFLSVVSKSKKNVIRGLHFQSKKIKSARAESGQGETLSIFFQDYQIKKNKMHHWQNRAGGGGPQPGHQNALA